MHFYLIETAGSEGSTRKSSQLSVIQDLIFQVLEVLGAKLP